MCLGVPGKIASMTGEEMDRHAKVIFGGTMIDVNMSYLPEAKVGDYVLVHVGFGLSVIDEDEALKTLEYLKEIGEIQEQLDEKEKSGRADK